MKKIKLFTLLSVLNLLLVACIQVIVEDGNENGKENTNSSSSSNSNNLKTGQVEIKGYPFSSGVISFTAAAKKITIDWGDDVIEEITLNGVERTFTHKYPNSNIIKILINTENMTSISYNWSNAHEARFGDCPNLEVIEINHNNLTVFDLNRANNLIELNIGHNKLKAEVLNKIFESLPTRTTYSKREINVYNNPGESESDFHPEIAIRKGWIVTHMYL